MQPDYSDVRFFDGECDEAITKLSYEIEYNEYYKRQEAIGKIKTKTTEGSLPNRWWLDGLSIDMDDDITTIVKEEWRPEDKELVFCHIEGYEFGAGLAFYDAEFASIYDRAVRHRDSILFDEYSIFTGIEPQWAQKARALIEVDDYRKRIEFAEENPKDIYIPKDKEFVYGHCHGYPFYASVVFYDAKKSAAFSELTGKRTGFKYDWYAPYQGEWPDWAKEAQKKLQD
jgi:hypothetical protein